MTIIHRDQSLGQLVTEQPSLARELERRGLDYCCGGSSTLAQACSANELDVATVIAELESLAVDDTPPEWSKMGLVQLVDHIESTHHRYLWDELPRLSVLFDKVAVAHGGNHPELADSQRCFEAIRGDLEPHLSGEEQRLFPMVRELAVADTRPVGDSGSVAESVSDMFAEHDAVGALLAQLRELTDDYTVPPDGCASYTALFTGLEALEADTHLHIHKENNLLLPAVVRLEQRLAS